MAEVSSTLSKEKSNGICPAGRPVPTLKMRKIRQGQQIPYGFLGRVAISLFISVQMRRSKQCAFLLVGQVNQVEPTTRTFILRT